MHGSLEGIKDPQLTFDSPLNKPSVVLVRGVWLILLAADLIVLTVHFWQSDAPASLASFLNLCLADRSICHPPGLKTCGRAGEHTCGGGMRTVLPAADRAPFPGPSSWASVQPSTTPGRRSLDTIFTSPALEHPVVHFLHPAAPPLWMSQGLNNPLCDIPSG